MPFFLSETIPGKRTLKRGKISREAPRPYKTEALTLTAELMSIAYGIRITAAQIRDRIKARQTSR